VSDFLAPADDYSDAHLVVDWPHTDLVRQKLNLPTLRSLVRVDGVDDARELLGLSRFRLSGVDESLPDSAVIEGVLGELRRIFAAEHDGWVPELDGNATMSGVVGYPHTKPMSFTSDLEPADATEFAIPEGTGGAGVRVAMLDTRLMAHPLLAGHAAAAPTDPPDPPAADAAWAGHGTFVAGLIAKEAPGCDIVVYGMLNREGRATVWDTAVALARLADEPVPYDVVNLSLGCRRAGPDGPLALRRAVERHAGRSLLVAAAGNHGMTEQATVPAWPAAFDGVVAVGATYEHDGERTVAEITPQLPWVDCLARGSGVVSTYVEGAFEVTHFVQDSPVTEVLRFDRYARWSGTSFAAAKVTGAVAKARTPGETPAETLHRLLATEGSGVSTPPWLAAGHAR
jgi:membrane-anchored mycosin MYCP